MLDYFLKQKTTTNMDAVQFFIYMGPIDVFYDLQCT